VIVRPEANEQWLRISPLAVIFFILNIAQKALTQGLPMLVVVFAWVASADGYQRYWLFRGAALLAIVGLGFSILSYLRFRYRIHDDRILLRQGVLHREALDVEFSRVQNITIKEPFYMRPLGLGVLSIDTAGSGAKEISIAGIQRDLAHELRDQILGAARSETTETTDHLVGKEEPRLLVALGRRDVLIYGLTANFMLWVAIAIGAIFGAGDLTERFFSWLAKRFAVEDTLVFLQNEGGTLLVVVAILGLMLLVLILLPLISILGALFRYDGYRLTVDGETYRKSSGLLTRFDDSIKQHKIQALVWKQNFIALFFNRISIQLRQASAGSEANKGPVPAKANFLVPSLRPEPAHELSGEFFPGCMPAQADYSNVDRRRFMVFNMAVLLLPATLIALIPSLLVSWKVLLVVPVFAGVLYMITTRRWQKTGYGVAGAYGFVRNGFLGTQTTIFPLFKVQRIDVRQTPIQHRKGLAHLTIHLASHSVKVPYVTVEDANLFRDLALYQAENSKVAWY
jgi:putative membrane protein